VRGWQLAAGVSLVLAVAMTSRAQDKFEIFGGYSYVRALESVAAVQLCPGPPCPTQNFSTNANLNGWEGSIEYRPFHILGFVADFGGVYGSLNNSFSNVSLHRNTYLFGPQVSWPSRVSPFAHVLFGVAHESRAFGGVTGGFVFNSVSDNEFAVAVGAGIDIKVIPHVWLRAIQVDYLGTNFNSNFQSQPRASAGVVIHF